MIVLLSISNSNNRLPTGNWFLLWGIIGFLLLASISFFEIKLRINGLKPSLVDSKNIWATHREKASQLGNRAFIIIGASRAQLGIDLNTIRKELGLEPVQLAIDGSQFMPVLKNLAADEKITGTILVSITADKVVPVESFQDKSTEWLEYYENVYRGNKEPYRWLNEKIIAILNNQMASRYKGAKPATVIYNYGIKKDSIRKKHLTTNKDRSVDADYKNIPEATMVYVYFDRVLHDIGLKIDRLNRFSPTYLQQVAINRIKKTEPANLDNFDEGLELLINYVRSIESRGGKVILVRMPTDKLLWEFDKRKYPRKLYWNRIQERFGNVIHFSDYPSLSKYDLPDGSHLDFRDKKSFTLALVKIINENVN